jgi:fatty acid desaturase
MLIQRNPMKRSCDYSDAHRPIQKEKNNMSLGTILIIILIVALLGGFTGVVGGYGYGFGHGGVGVLGTVLIIVLILVLLGRL